MISPWIAVAVGDWKTFLLVTSLPVIVVPLMYFLVEESALWLISMNDIDAAVNCFVRVAKFNRNQLTESDIDDFRRTIVETKNTEKRTTSTLIGLFKTPRLRRLTLILFFKSWVHIQSSCRQQQQMTQFFTQNGHNIVLRCDIAECWRSRIISVYYVLIERNSNISRMRCTATVTRYHWTQGNGSIVTVD